MNKIITIVAILLYTAVSAQTNVSFGYGTTNYKPMNFSQQGITVGESQGHFTYVSIGEDEGATVTFQPTSNIKYNDVDYTMSSVGLMAFRSIGNQDKFHLQVQAGINVYNQKPVAQELDGVKNGLFFSPMGGLTIGYNLLEVTYLPLGNVIAAGINIKL